MRSKDLMSAQRLELSCKDSLIVVRDAHLSKEQANNPRDPKCNVAIHRQSSIAVQRREPGRQGWPIAGSAASIIEEPPSAQAIVRQRAQGWSSWPLLASSPGTRRRILPHSPTV